jgi:hypothetical protein
MKMIKKIAYYLGRRDEEPNIRLAAQLCATPDTKGIREIVEGLQHPKRQVANDCIKVLYEIAERKPELIGDYVADFIRLLRSQNNRLVWGAMTALAKITFLKPAEVFQHLDAVIKAYETGSIITVDQSISVFAELSRAGKKYERIMFKRIIQHLDTCRPREVGQHAERAFICVHSGNHPEFLKVLLKRKEHVSEAQKRRIEKLIKKIQEGRFED